MGTWGPSLKGIVEGRRSELPAVLELQTLGECTGQERDGPTMPVGNARNRASKGTFTSLCCSESDASCAYKGNTCYTPDE